MAAGSARYVRYIVLAFFVRTKPALFRWLGHSLVALRARPGSIPLTVV